MVRLENTSRPYQDPALYQLVSLEGTDFQRISSDSTRTQCYFGDIDLLLLGCLVIWLNALGYWTLFPIIVTPKTKVSARMVLPPIDNPGKFFFFLSMVDIRRIPEEIAISQDLGLSAKVCAESGKASFGRGR